MLKIDNVKVYSNLSFVELKAFVCKNYKIKESDIINFVISKKSIDARDKEDVHFVYSFDIECSNEKNYSRYVVYDEKNAEDIQLIRTSTKRPVVVGSGPARIILCIRAYKIRFKTDNFRKRKKSRRENQRYKSLF